MKKLEIGCVKYMFLIMIGFLFIGCGQSYSVVPIYDKNNQTLKVGTMSFDGADEISNKSVNPPGYGGVFKVRIQSYLLNNGKCKNFSYRYIEGDNNSYINNNTEDDLKKIYLGSYNGNCAVTKISNLKFFKCIIKFENADGNGNSLGGERFVIGSDTLSAYGYKSTTTVNLDSDCFYTLLNHYKKIAKKDKIEIEEYSFRKNFR